MRNEIFRTSRIERWGFALFMAGQGIVNTYVGSYLQLYLTDIGITAVAVGVMFLIARGWDAVNDPIFGAILDKLNLKGGKFLPFLRASNIMLPLVVVLLFAIPGGLPVGLKLAWAFVAYLLYDVAYTMCDVPIFAMTSAVTDQVHERIGIMSRNTVLSAIAMLIIMVAAPQLYPTIGATGVAVIVAVSAAVLMFFMSRFAKERYINKDEEEVGLKQMADYVKDNKYLRIGFLGIMVLSLTSMTNAVLNYFAIWCLGDMGMVSIISVMLALPSLFVAAVMPALTRRFVLEWASLLAIFSYNRGILKSR